MNKQNNKAATLTKLIFKLLCKFDEEGLHFLSNKYLQSTRNLNRDVLKAHERVSQNWYQQYIPDRYSLNLNGYKKSVDFLSFNDAQYWIRGNEKNNSGDLNRFFLLNLCIDFLIEEGINGNVAELGVYKGNSAVLLAKYARRVNSTAYLFDTFEGFDEKDLVDIDADKGKLSFSDTSLPDVQRMIGERNAIFVKGYFPDSLAQIGEVDSFSLVHIDCDLEKPFVSALDYFYPRLKEGGFLIMHDYSSLFWPGAKKAIDNFFEDKAEFVIPVPDKSGTCIVRKTKEK